MTTTTHEQQPTFALALRMAHIADELRIAGETAMGDVPIAFARRFHKLTEEVAALSHWISDIAAAEAGREPAKERDGQ